jgi:hypothetical protein
LTKPVPHSFLLPAKAYLGSEDVQRLTEAAVFVADEIWVSATMGIDPVLPEEKGKALRQRFRELVEIGAVRTWEIEGQAGFLGDAVEGGPLSASPDSTVALDRYRGMHADLVDRLADIRKALVTGQAASSFDGVTEVVLGKHLLGSLGVRALVECSDLLLDPIAADAVTRYLDPLFAKSNLISGAIEELQPRLALPDVSLLDQDQIEECRRLMPSFRKELVEQVNHASSIESASSSIEKITDELVARYEEVAAGGDAANTNGWRLGRLKIPDDALGRIYELLFGSLEGGEDAIQPGMLLLRLLEFSRSR